MGALIKACQKSGSIKNTGSECNESMGPTAMLIAVPKNLKWQTSDMVNFAQYLETQIHASRTSRVFPMFGPSVPIRKITSSKESDVIPVQEDGTPIFVRYGSLTRMYATTEGGICFAAALQSLNKSGYSIIEIDNANQVLMRSNADGSFSGLQCTFMYSPSPDLADMKNPGYVNFQISFRPEEYVQFGEIFQGDSSLSALLGLYDTAVVPDALPSSITKLKFDVHTVCGLTDLIAQFGATLAALSNFTVTKDSDGSSPTVTAIAIVSGHLEITGTFVSGSKYTVALVAPSVLLAALIAGYEGTVAADILIP